MTTTTPETNLTPAGSFGAFLVRAQREAGVTDGEVATALGFKSDRVYPLMKSGAAKLPLSRIGPLARALKLPETELLREFVRCYYGDELLQVIERMLLRGLSDQERRVVEAFRRLVRAEPDAEVQVIEARGALVVALGSEPVAS